MENINLTPLLKSIFDYDPDGPNMCKTAGGRCFIEKR